MPFNTQAPWTVTQVIDQIASRAFNVLYTNNTGKTMFVMINVSQQVSAALDTSAALCRVDGDIVVTSSIQSVSAATNISINRGIVFAVPPGSTYQVLDTITGTGTINLTRWIEAY